MLNPFKDVNWNPDRAARRTFAKSLIIGFPLVGLFFLLTGWLRGAGWNVTAALTVGGIGAGAGLIFLAVPSIARPFYVVWYAVACSIGLVIGNVLMALVYWVVVAGIGLGMRAFGRHPLQKGPNRSAATYWLDAGAAPPPRQYFRQY